MPQKKVIVSVSNDLYTDNRVNKVCLFLKEQGYDVLLVGRKRKNSLTLAGRSYQMRRLNLLFDKGPLFYAALNIRLFFFLLFKKADILVSNDLDTLAANYYASKFKKGTKLVYDTHEYFTEVPELINRPKIRNFWLAIERRIFPNLTNIITVNESIASKYQERYGKKLAVVRNVGPKWKPSNYATRKELGLPLDKFIVIIQGSGINVDRGAEEAVEAIQKVDGAVLIFVGDGDVIPQIKADVQTRGLQEKILFFGKRPYTELMQFTHAADVGLSIDKPLSDNYLYSLPNKLFDYIHASTPIICTDLPEVRRIIDRHHIGIVLPHLSVESLAEAIKTLKENSNLYNQLKKNCLPASEIENWESECKVLERFYPRV